MKIKNIVRVSKAVKAGRAVHKRLEDGTVNGFVLREVGGKYNIYAVTSSGTDKLIGRYTDLEKAKKAYELLKAIDG